VRAVAGFIVRLVVYAVVLGASARLADALWNARVVDASIEMQIFHDTGLSVLLIAPLVLALLGFGVLRRVAIFAAGALIGMALTAPFACANLSGG
jgi:hypothetical protein